MSVISKIKHGLKSKLYLMSGLFISLMLVNFIVITLLIEDKKQDSVGINLTSRQSVLVQKYVKNFFFFMETKKIQDVTQVVTEFETNAKTLLHGQNPVPAKEQPAPVPGEDPVIVYDIDKSLSPEVIGELQDINNSWAELKKLAISLLSITPEEKVAGYEKLVKAGEDLSNKIDHLVERHKLLSDKKFDKIFQTQVTVIIVSLIFTIFMLVYFSRTFVAKIFSSFANIEFFTKNLSGQSESIQSSSEIVNTNSKQLSTSVEETMAAITELTEITRLNEENTEKSRVSSSSCSSQATYGKESVQKLMNAIQLINEANKKLSQQIDQGNHEFKKILDLVNGISSETSIINDIVFQTKLLSFNASVEAARAGESGKGFSVVAEEVGNLAVMSGNSAQKISGILHDSQKTIEEIINNNARRTEDILKECQTKVNQGLEFAKKCGESFESIYRDVQNVDEIIKQLASSSKEQTAGISMINNSMTNINNACQQNDASANDMMATVQEMVDSTQKFQHQISEFSFLLLGQQSKQEPPASGSNGQDVIELIETKGA